MKTYLYRALNFNLPSLFWPLLAEVKSGARQKPSFLVINSSESAVALFMKG